MSMKSNRTAYKPFGMAPLYFAAKTASIVVFAMTLKDACFADVIKYEIKPGDIITSARATDVDYKHQVEDVAIRYAKERRQLIGELINILVDPKSSNLDQCTAAYYLGEMRASEAVSALANKITINLDIDRLDLHALPIIGENCAMEALIKIGNSSIPALIQNIAVSDAANVREMSLKALYRIESDKEIVQLRLQKALQTETNAQKQAHLESALLTSTNFG
jgi:hypothetical protein